ncbi:hypothetical protein [Lacrimispora indolis]|uniref:hypothetical protein n=1 Tax=Lacrimispora indolis TaxID=69825 RepID=UPI000421FD17|nr:hypothetical protein [[Clostridium] methoxybenzovorans]
MKTALKRACFEYEKHEVYAIIYKKSRIILYNSNFSGETKVFYMVPELKDGKEKSHAEVL